MKKDTTLTRQYPVKKALNKVEMSLSSSITLTYVFIVLDRESQHPATTSMMQSIRFDVQ